jgi:WD40 repeat protein
MPRKTIFGGVLMSAMGILLWLVFGPHGLSGERRWHAQVDDIGGLLYSPNGQTLYSFGRDGMKAWNASAGTLRTTLPVFATPMALSPQGNLMLGSGTRRPTERTLTYYGELWDVANGTQVGTIEHLLLRAAFSPDGKTLVTTTGPEAGGNATIEVWALPGLTAVRSWPQTSMVGDVRFSPDGKLLGVSKSDAIDLLDPGTGRATQKLSGPTSGSLGELHFSADGKTVHAMFHSYPTNATSLWEWDLSSSPPNGQGRRVVAFEHGIRASAFSVDGKKLAVLLYWMGFSRHDRLEVWDTTRGRRVGIYGRTPPWMWSLALSPDGKRVAVGFQIPHFRQPADIAIWRVE